MRRVTTPICVICAALLTAVLPASSARGGGILYGLSGLGTSGTLYTIDTNTGAATAVVNLSGAVPLVFPTLGGLDFLGDRLYATGVYNGSINYEIGTIDPSTGVFTSIAVQDQANWHGLAANQSAGVLYTVGVDFTPSILKSITPAGAITDIGSTGSVDGGGLAYDDVHGILYATGLNNLYTLDTSTAAPTLVGDMGFTPDPAGLAYDPALDVLYLNDGGTNSFYRVDTSTGAATFIGLNGANAKIDALPEPPAAGVLCAGAVLIGLLRRR